MAEGLGQVISWYVCTVAAVCFLAVRLVVKWRKFKAFTIDDYLLILAASCLIGDLAIQQYMWDRGMASIGTASRENFVNIMQMIIPGSVLYVTSLWAIKVALVIFYKRIAARTKLQTVYNVVLGFLAVSWLVIFFDIIFQCFPTNRKWTQDPNKTCSSKASDINYWLTILLNIGTDLVIISLPITMVLKLQMPMKQKLGVAGMFALGGFVVISSIIRAYYSRLNETMLTCTVSMIETAIAIIATCLPVLRTLILGHISRVGTSRSAGRHYELSSRRPGNGTEVTQHNNTLITGGVQRGHESEDELVKEGTSVSSIGMAVSDQNGITVAKEYQVFEEPNSGDGKGRIRF
ncbi:hypothetical protein BGZ60DRAFT_566429 [Tricladium varicosporioides]|nr:hypothetical protein BGZ60DRAFT_566429 [Hymenoscyphus varicosporioides]